MKSVIKLVRLLVFISLFLGSLFVITNKTFIYTSYKNENMKNSIKLERFMYLLSDDNNKLIFKTPLNYETLEKNKNTYLDSLDLCLGKYYVDKKAEITITKYEVKDDKFLRTVKIDYTLDNYCGSDFTLSDMWLYEYNSLSEVEKSSISEKAIAKLMEKIFSSKRVEEPKLTNYKSSKSIKIDCSYNEEKYTLIFEDFSENEIIVKKVVDKKEQYAIYNVENAKEYLTSLESL